MYQSIRFGIQLFAALLSVILLMAGVWNFNLYFVISATLVALFAGRFFCGWFCPLGLWTEKVLPLITKDRTYPEFWKNPKLQTVVAALLITFFVTLRFTGLSAPQLALTMMGSMFALATVFALAYYPKFWCANLCPWGLFGRFMASRARYQMAITGDCRSCGLCERSCPIGDVAIAAVAEKESTPNEAAIFSNRCIRCMRCTEACPTGAIDWLAQGPAGNSTTQKLGKAG